MQTGRGQSHVEKSSLAGDGKEWGGAGGATLRGRRGSVGVGPDLSRLLHLEIPTDEELPTHLESWL